MRHLQKPTDDNGKLLDAVDVFDTCVLMVKNPSLKTELQKERSKVNTEPKDYNDKAILNSLNSRYELCFHYNSAAIYLYEKYVEKWLHS